MPPRPRFRKPSWRTETESRWHSQTTLRQPAARKCELRLQTPAWNIRLLCRRWLGCPCSTHRRSEAQRHSYPCPSSGDDHSPSETDLACLFGEFDRPLRALPMFAGGSATYLSQPPVPAVCYLPVINKRALLR